MEANRRVHYILNGYVLLWTFFPFLGQFQDILLSIHDDYNKCIKNNLIMRRVRSISASFLILFKEKSNIRENKSYLFTYINTVIYI